MAEVVTSRWRDPRHLLIVLSVALLAVRLVAARTVGFGDSEALYAAYALHPAPAYLDHPGLIGLFARVVGEGTAPRPMGAHYVTSLMATLFPWIVVAAARAAGASSRRAFAAGLAVVAAPEIAVGLFAMTPDLLLAVTWTLALGLAARALGERPGSGAAVVTFLAAGLLAGVAATAKISGVLLIGALFVTYAARPARAHARTAWPWAGLLVGAVAFAPVALHEARAGWPMLRHRLVDTQSGAGLSVKNLGAVLGGQLLYLSPLLAVAAVLVAVDLVRARRAGGDAITALLFHATFGPLVVLLLLSLWSPVAEPHWPTPALLALPLHFARRGGGEGGGVLARLTPRFTAATVGLGGAMSAAVFAWVLVPNLARLLPASFDPKLDIANELYGWPEAIAEVREALREESGQRELVVVGPHWVVCAQLHAALGPNVRVGCMTPIRDDFDAWEPRARWKEADAILYVTDNRFPTEAASMLPQMSVARRSRVTSLRGGRVARTFVVTLLESRART